MASAQPAGIMSGWPDISCATGPTLIGASVYIILQAGRSFKELLHWVVAAGLFLLLNPLMSQSFHRLVAVMMDPHSIGQEDAYCPLSGFLWERWQGVARPALLVFRFLSCSVEKAGNKMGTASVNAYMIYGELRNA